jgi:pimeloyl-ACP methyl ester carboxylesterase
LLLPADSGKPAPGIVALPSTANQTIRQPAGIEGKPQEAWGPLLARRGFTVICPRCFLWPGGEALDTKNTLAELHKRHAGAKGMAKMLYDARRAVDILAAQPGVDATRIGAVGHSLGGKEVLYLAAFDERIKAAVSSEGGIGTRFSNWHDPWYLTDAIQKPQFDREHHELLALVAPRPFLLIGGDSADGSQSWPFIEAALPVYRLYGEPARVGLLNHKQGHSIPPIAVERTVEWFEAYLK